MSTTLLRTIPRTLLRTSRSSAARAPQHQQQFSILTRARQAARGFESHPVEHMPRTQKRAPADYGRLARNVGGAGMFYFPLLGVMLLWPLAAEKLLDGSIV